MTTPPAWLRRAPDTAAARAIVGQLQLHAAERGVALRAPPAEPTTCCGRGCNGCVWEGWLDAVDYWRQEALWQCEAP